MTEQPIILEDSSGRIDFTVAHTPLTVAPDGRRFPDLERAFPPQRWWAVCGVRGQVYVRGGSLETVPACAACTALERSEAA